MTCTHSVIHDLSTAPSAGYAAITEAVDRLLDGYSPRSRAALMVLRTAALQSAHAAPGETAAALRFLADEVEGL